MAKNRIALVTGGSGGLGTAICQSLSAIGYRVVANYHPDFEDSAIQWHKDQRALGFDFDIAPGDVSNSEQCTGMLERVTATIGPVDCLVNNAGITRDARIQKMPVEQWDAVINTNLNSMFYVTKPVINGMLERCHGRIINISSVSGQRGQFGQTNYAAAKAGVHGFTMALAREVASKGITVNSISPGYIGTEMVQAIREDILAQVVEQIPVGRLGKPEEVARMVAFLAHQDAGYITGSDFCINGGLHMY
jgi:acetoacetyl-CoA reductase